MAIHGFLGGVISATAPSVTTAGASGIFTLEEQLQAAGQNNWPGYQISRSVRIRSSATAYLNRTYGVATNNQKGTISVWIKQGLLNQRNTVWASASGAIAIIFGTTAGACNLQLVGSGLVGNGTTQVFRDPGAWFHLVVAVDTTQATGSDRIKAYINNTAITLPDTATQNAAFFTDSIAYNIGNYANNAALYYDGYMAEFNFVDGQQLTPASFGVTDSVTGVWNPIRYSGTYGNNGFYLNFSDNSNNTATTIGKDSSGNGNNWTPNNISVTAGTTYDSMVDVPIGYGGDTGVGGEVRGNYCTLNPLNNNNTLSNANLRAVTATNTNTTGTLAISSGKWYFEATITTAGGSYPFVGITPATEYYGGSTTSFVANSIACWAGNGAFANGDVCGFAFDLNGLTFTAYKNGVALGSTYYGNSTGGLNTIASGRSWVPAISGVSSTIDMNFGQRAFSYTAPSGYKALCTQNLTAPSIVNGANYMAASLYTGTGASQTVSNAVNSISFQPDWVWIKSRSAATDHKLTDSVRGATKAWISNSTAAETTDSTGLTAFGSSGFTVGASTTYNNSGATYVGWGWKGGGTAVTNTSGTVNSSVSANTTAGFSAVTYTGSASAVTVGHGLGVAPSMLIVKALGTPNGTARPSLVYHISFGATKILYLDRTDAATTTSGPWNDTAPTSTVFSLGTEPSTNWASNNYVAYCFAAISGYSAFGSYTGNGSTDGPFVFTGMRPRWLMVKAYSGGTGEWPLIDSSRGAYNVASPELYASLTQADTSSNMFDLLSNGFKSRSTNANCNASGVLYIYAAFAENPFNISRAR